MAPPMSASSASAPSTHHSYGTRQRPDSESSTSARVADPQHLPQHFPRAAPPPATSATARHSRTIRVRIMRQVGIRIAHASPATQRHRPRTSAIRLRSPGHSPASGTDARSASHPAANSSTRVPGASPSPRSARNGRDEYSGDGRGGIFIETSPGGPPHTRPKTRSRPAHVRLDPVRTRHAPYLKPSPQSSHSPPPPFSARATRRDCAVGNSQSLRADQTDSPRPRPPERARHIPPNPPRDRTNSSPCVFVR